MDVSSPDVYFDMKVEATGVHAAGTTTWTLPHPHVCTHAIIHATGKMVALTQNTDYEFEAAGDYAGLATLCVQNAVRLELSQPFPPLTDKGAPEIKGFYAVRTLTLQHDIESAFKLAIDFFDTRSTVNDSYNPDPVAMPEAEYQTTSFRIGTKASNCRITITNIDWRNIQIASAQFEGFVGKGTR